MRWLAAAVPPLLIAAALWLPGAPAGAQGMGAKGKAKRKPDPGCISCHQGIEIMHPWDPLSCTDCHGGDGQTKEKERAHVQPSRPVPNDERTVGLKHDLAYRRFVNPSDLRVLDKTCAKCHEEICANLPKSLHGTTAGHLSDGLYENGVVRSKNQRYAIFPVRDEDGDTGQHGLKSLPGLPGPSVGAGTKIGQHFSDLPRKSCMACHLYSRGMGVRGRLGQDGWYRSEGCAACHVTYNDEGVSMSADKSIDTLEPGHPIKHTMTSKIPTRTCTVCHALDANIGMSFRGLAQLPPGVPGGPDVPGTTNKRSQGQFFLNDPRICPPDIHHERGMHCIDCHTGADTMGDGNIYGVMEYGVGVDCSTCHGTFTKRATFKTSNGGRLDHVQWIGGQAVLTGRVSGKRHTIKQVVDVLDKKSPLYNARAAKAMNPVTHGRMTCYACHSGWSVNFFGFHFDRNESFTQLDILSGQRTPGRVTTQEKVFASFKHFYLGFDSEGHIAPYMVGFSTTGTFRDKKGDVVLRQALPVTAAGLSGMTLIHHQLHTVRPAARNCSECHGAPGVLGTGSENFHLFRDLFVVVGDAGLTVCGFAVKNPSRSVAIANVPLPSRPRAVALLNDRLSGRMQVAYVAGRDGDVHVIDVSDPVSPRYVTKMTVGDARSLQVREGTLLIAAGKEGLVLASLDKPERPKEVARVKTTEARSVHVDGIYAYVADGPAGLRIVDVSVANKPAPVGIVDLNGRDSRPVDANDVTVHFLAAQPDVVNRRRTRGRNVAFVADGVAGLYAVDVTYAERPEVILRGIGGGVSATALAFSSNYDLGSAGGDIPSAEREYLYLVGTSRNQSSGRLLKLDVGDPTRPMVTGNRQTVTDPRDVKIARVFQAPFLKQYAIVVGRGNGNVEICDVTNRGGQIPQAGVIDGTGGARGIDLEYMPLDRLVGLDGNPLKDVSHAGARLFTRKEIVRILRAEVR
ncbi:MAG: hypothetical protein ACYTGN_11870 [Planctomycetota bacterium]